MHKPKLIDYLNKQMLKFENTTSNILAANIKIELINIFDDVFGTKNKYSKTIENTALITFESNDELYPKTVIDELKSKQQLKISLKNVTEQIEIFEPEEIKKAENQNKIEIKSLMQKYLSDSEIEAIDNIVKSNKKEQNLTELTDYLRVLETEKRLNILAEVFKGFL